MQAHEIALELVKLASESIPNNEQKKDKIIDMYSEYLKKVNKALSE